MSIVRKPLQKEQPFTVYANDLLNDENLSAEALGMLVYLLSKPGNWRVMPGQLGKRFGIGRDKVYRIMNDLIAAGYAERFQERLDGAFSDRNFLVSNEKRPLPENTDTANADTANPPLQKKDKKQKTDSYSSDFETKVWEPYPRKANSSKKKAWDVYRMLNDENQARVIAAIPIFAQAMAAEDRPESKIQHLATFLNGKVWETVALPGKAKTAEQALNWHLTASREQWEKLLRIYEGDSNWRAAWGPAPGKPGCAVPPDLIERLPYHLKPRASQSRVRESAEAGGV